jgi:DNA polymerase
MVSTPWFPEMAEIARSHPEWDLGIHLTFTSEWEGYRWRPLTGRSPESGLLDPSGYYWKTLADVREALGDCRRCPLCDTRTNLVFGEGNLNAGLAFVGEAPGADEDIQARPFVGKAGQLLTRIIVAMGLQRQDVYICNILKCRPPENRNPRPEEIAACEPFLIRQLQAIQPKIICALGTFSAHTLLKTDVPISVLRGRFHSYQGIPLMPTYHPAYLLRNPGAKKQVWEDVQKIMKAL